jgi:hypothetical protein
MFCYFLFQIRNLLTIDPLKRFTAEQALAHPFLSGHLVCFIYFKSNFYIFSQQMTLIEITPPLCQTPRRLWQRAIICILFIVHLPRLRDGIERPVPRKCLFRDRMVCACVFLIIYILHYR